MADTFVLDTSAIFTFTDNEAGADEIEKLLKSASAGRVQILICEISLMELFYISCQHQSEDMAAKLVALVKSWPIQWVSLNEKILLQGGKLKANYRLSLADALIAAVAKLYDAQLVHKDPEFNELKQEISLKPLPFKT